MWDESPDPTETELTVFACALGVIAAEAALIATLLHFLLVAPL